MTRKEWNHRRHEDAKKAYAAFMKYYPLTLEDLPGEVWKVIPDYEDYQVSNFGRVKSFKNEKQRILKSGTNTMGYLFVCLCKGGKPKNFFVHRLVALCFIPNPENKPEINHIDGHPLNNHVSNLEWCTRSENVQHALDTGLIPQGEDNLKALLSNEQVHYIRENPKGLTGRQLAQKFDVDKRTISLIQLGKIYKAVGGTFRKAQSQKYTPRIPDEIRSQIRAEYVKNSRKFGSVALGKKYGVDSSTILDIVHEG